MNKWDLLKKEAREQRERDCSGIAVIHKGYYLLVSSESNGYYIDKPYSEFRDAERFTQHLQLLAEMVRWGAYSSHEALERAKKYLEDFKK